MHLGSVAQLSFCRRIVTSLKLEQIHVKIMKLKLYIFFLLVGFVTSGEWWIIVNKYLLISTSILHALKINKFIHILFYYKKFPCRNLFTRTKVIHQPHK